MEGNCFFCGKNNFKEEFITEHNLCGILCCNCKKVERFYQYSDWRDLKRIRELLGEEN